MQWLHILQTVLVQHRYAPHTCPSYIDGFHVTSNDDVCFDFFYI